jgi:hypothetical protein
MNHRWPLHPPSRYGEALSSWLSRLNAVDSYNGPRKRLPCLMRVYGNGEPGAYRLLVRIAAAIWATPRVMARPVSWG